MCDTAKTCLKRKEIDNKKNTRRRVFIVSKNHRTDRWFLIFIIRSHIVLIRHIVLSVPNRILNVSQKANRLCNRSILADKCPTHGIERCNLVADSVYERSVFVRTYREGGCKIVEIVGVSFQIFGGFFKT